ncbi:lens fiber membrane intrinsic protein [Camarhynchus parvulus]|uniref:lens fiber membrane intrinsic protein n=1 Tax=Geospiza parvula TaxID=87175 RepID=UPI0012381505|nr:lens fiber membrane intrinsic protein [Camarhynchus parvulus]
MPPGGSLCGATGLALLVAATATPFWAQRGAPGGTASVGLWHGCLGGQCHPHATAPALLEATRALLLLSVVAAAAGLVLGLPLGTGGARRERERAAGATLLLAGPLASPGRALLGLGLGSGGALALLGPPRSSWSFSWSFILAWVAAALLGSAGIFHICSASKDPSPESSEVGGS